ncbi:MAG: response regulator, partial [Bacillota bacterium]|nr:response regulator [Bacillota bacterium]
AGLTLNRGEMITIIDLKYVLDGVRNDRILGSMVLLCEFNKLKVGFAIDSVSRIYKIGWNQIVKSDSVGDNPLVIGNIDLDGTIVMLLDFEKIVMDVNPKSGIHESMVADVKNKDRKHYKIMVVDDSPTVRNVILQTLSKAGVHEIKLFEDGLSAFEYLNALAETKGGRFTEDVNLVITDIEMPVLDGHALTRRIKEHKVLRAMPVVIFSSLITGALRHKGDSVGADAQLSKPEIAGLIGQIDELLEK